MEFVTKQKEATINNNKTYNKYNEILIEYDEKRDNFDPTGKSPNVFVNKLELRMQKYYNLLYMSNNSITK